MTYHNTNVINFTVRSSGGNWTGTTPDCFDETLRHRGEDGLYDVCDAESLREAASRRRDSVSFPEALKMTCNQANVLPKDSKAYVEMQELAAKYTPLGATDVSLKVRIEPNGGGEKGKWNASLAISYIDSLGIEVCSLLPFVRICWDKHGNWNDPLKYSAHLMSLQAYVEDKVECNRNELERPSDLADAVFNALAKEEGCSLRREGRNTWSVTIPEGKGADTASDIARRIVQSASLFSHSWTVEHDIHVPGIHDLNYLCKVANDILDSSEQAVKQIDEDGYGVYKGSKFRAGHADKINSLLERTAGYKDSIDKLSKRIGESHDRMVQVIGNAKSVSQGSTSHLFE